MNRRIPLDQPFSLSGRVELTTTKRCFEGLAQQGKDPERVHQKISAMRVLIFYPYKRGSDLYSLYTTDGVFSVKLSDDGSLLMTNYSSADLKANNKCIKSGVTVQPTHGVTVRIKLRDRQLFCCYHDGRPVADSQNRGNANYDLFRYLNSPVFHNHKENRAHYDDADEPYSISEAAEDFLSIAEGYTRTDADIELAKIQKIPPLTYWDFRAAQSYDRQDRVAYTAYVAPYDIEQYSVDTKVQLELEDGKILSATIVAEGEEDELKTVTLLFDEQISFAGLPKSGQIRPNYSDIQNEVRQDVIDGIRSGETSATYLADILGEYKTSGSTKKDLSALDADLRSKKYPPNQSQIDAIHRGIETNDILLVLGPPGTGKTTVILEWVKYLIKQEGKRVLISSQNNKAVDNVLERLTQEKDISAIRAGNEAKVQANMYPYLLENRIKRQREEIEKAVKGELQQLEQLDADYLHYIELIDIAATKNRAIEQWQQTLKNEAAKGYMQYRMALLDWQNDRVDLRAKMRRILESVRLYEKLMVDPEKHPFLRWLLSPFRGFFRKRLNNALEDYDAIYSEYAEKINKCKAAYERLSMMQHDQALIELAENVSRSEREYGESVTTLATPVSDSIIWPDSAWPSVNIPCTATDLSNLRRKVSEREARLQTIKTASIEWSEHIQSQSNYALADLLLESVDLVGGTCIGINSQRKFANIGFDVTIIDEAGQIQIHNALVPMSRAPKVIMLGDHKQIPPMADEEQIKLCEESGIDPTLLSTSLFEELYNNLPKENKVLLDTQYRMPAQIADLLSEWFYEGQYKSFSGKKDLPSICPLLFTSSFAVLSTSDAGDLRFEYKPDGGGAGNHYEADLISSIVCALMSGDYGGKFSPSDFGIISPYGEQVDNIRKKLKNAIPSLTPIEIHDMVASLDSFQGQERDIILYSCTRSNQLPPHRSRIGFLKELRRLNVALSRPKKELVFIGDIDFLSACKNGEGKGSEKEFSEFIGLMSAHAKQNGEFILSNAFKNRLKGR